MLSRVSKDAERKLGKPSAHEIITQVGKQHAESREMAGRVRNNDSANADLARDRRGMKRPGAAICHQARNRRRPVRAPW